MEPDKYQGQEGGIQCFSQEFELITPSDSTNLPERYKAILCGGTAGPVTVHNHAGVSCVLYVGAGQVLQGVRPTRILATGTTATPLFGIL